MAQFNYNKKRYWYHLSHSFDSDFIVICPWERRSRRAASEPDGKRLCVSPSIAHCLTALPHRLIYTIYRTKEKVIAEEPVGVYDSVITKEGWITKKVELIKIGKIDLREVEEQLGELPIEAAVLPREDFSRRALRQWNNFAELYVKS